MTRARERSRESIQAITMRQAQQQSSAAKVATASEAKAGSEALAAAVPADLSATLADYNDRLLALENP